MPQTTFRTALITGASAGLGAEYARQLAAAGTNLILVARRLDRLAELAHELREKHAVDVEGLQADLATAEGIERVEHRIAETATLDLLINNAGIGGGPGSFAEREAGHHLGMVQVHVATTVRLCRTGSIPLVFCEAEIHWTITLRPLGFRASCPILRLFELYDAF